MEAPPSEKRDRLATCFDSGYLEAFDALGRCLYEQLEHLDPSDSEDFVAWGDLRERDREVYRACIHRVIDLEADTIAPLLNLCVQRR